MELKLEDYQEMLVDYNGRGESADAWEVACEWMKRHKSRKNKFSWAVQWQPRNDEKNVLYIGGIFPLRNNLHSSTGIVSGEFMS